MAFISCAIAPLSYNGDLLCLYAHGSSPKAYVCSNNDEPLSIANIVDAHCCYHCLLGLVNLVMFLAYSTPHHTGPIIVSLYPPTSGLSCGDIWMGHASLFPSNIILLCLDPNQENGRGRWPMITDHCPIAFILLHSEIWPGLLPTPSMSLLLYHFLIISSPSPILDDTPYSRTRNWRFYQFV